MNCEDFLDAIVSSDEQQQAMARSHANSCPSCAALVDVHVRLQKELAATELLPQRMRAVWATAADESPQIMLARAVDGRISDRRLLLFVLSTALAGAVLPFLTLSIWWIYGDQASIQPDAGNLPMPPVATRQIDATAELITLLAEVNALEAELNKTSKHAELLDARHEANVLLATYNNW